MADAQVIKEFLVSLGFKTDQQSQKSMLRTVADVTASLRNLATVAVAATAAAGAAIAKMATDLDELYYSSKRIGSSANEIKAFGHAVGQLGGSAEGAVASLENLARNIRQSPGYIGLLRRLGVQTHDSAGNVRDMTVQMVELGEQLRKMPTHLAYQFADLLGIDEKTLLAMREGVGEFSGEYRALLKATGSDLDQSAADAHAAMKELRTTGALLSLVLIKLQNAVLRFFTPAIKAFNSAILGSAQSMEKFFSVAGRLAGRLMELIQPLLDIGRQFLQWVDRVVGLQNALLGLLAIINPGAALAVALLALYDDWKTYREGGLFSLPWDEIEKRWDHMGDTVARVGKACTEWFQKIGSAIKEWVTDKVDAASRALDALYQAAARFWAGDGKKAAESTAAAATGSTQAQAAPAPTKPPAKPAKPAASTTKPAQPAPAPAKPTPEQAAKAANETTGGARRSLFMDFLAAGEGGRHGYEAYNAGTKGTPVKINSKGEKYQSVVHGGSYKAATGRSITDMTIREVLAASKGTGMDKGRIFAAGRYQFIKDTLQGTVKSMDVSLDEKFTPEMQDRIAEHHIKQGAPSLWRYMYGGSSVKPSKKDLDWMRQQYRSLPTESGRTWGDSAAGANKAAHTHQQFMDVIERQRAATMMNRGLPSAPPSPGGQQAAGGQQRQGVTINQTTNVNVTGAADPAATASAVTGAQNHVNQQLARNARSAVVG